MEHVRRQQAVLAIQRSAGNVATQRTLAPSPLARAGAKAPAEARIGQLEQRTKILEKKQEATAQDLRWRAKFGAALASRRRAAARMTRALDMAGSGFQKAQMAQQQTDMLKLQVCVALFAFGFSAGFEWLFTKAAHNVLRLPSGRVKDLTEKFENPANTAVQGGGNVAVQLGQASGAKEAEAPADTGSPLAFLASSLETIAEHEQAIEAAFEARADKLANASEDAWLRFDPAVQERAYEGLLAQIDKFTAGAEKLRELDVLALVLERQMWALWLKQHPTLKYGLGNLGNDIEDRLNELGIGGAAGVELTGVWYDGNEPDEWRKLLLDWASGYQASIRY